MIRTEPTDPLSGIKRFSAIRSELTEPLADTIAAPSEFMAVLNARGLYSTTQFVLRLNPRIHELVDAITSGTTEGYETDELLSAYSTYLHETIHWWQHVGSTAGLILSLCYPAQCLANLEDLRTVITKVGPKKSLKLWAENALGNGAPASDEGLIAANRAVNNTIDTEFFKALAIIPMKAAPALFEDRYFECVGHSYSIAYANTLHALIDSCDFDPASLPDPQQWSEPLERLRQEQHEGFYHGSPIRRARVGLLDIFEGQARFNQLQFLRAAGGPYTCLDYRDAGFFEGNYVSAFEEFLRLTESAWPERIDDPLINLFLLVCDLALNPTRGLPFQISSFEDLLIDIDCGARFTRLCAVARETPTMKVAILDRSFQEYAEMSSALTGPCGYDHPLAALEEIVDLIENDPGAQTLMSEWKTFAFSTTNQPLRVIVSHFLAFSRDKLAHPELFCWPGAFTAGSGISPIHQELFLRHLSLFSDRADNDGIFPRAWPHRSQDSVHMMQNVFFGSIIMYDLARQWILEDGPFRYNYRWLTGRSENDALIAWAKLNFEKMFGAHHDAFEMVVEKA
ncbi:hypothetical protein EV128_10925 [Rhizobium azibense]|nr:hypothetical protein EV128_10925 [Rhizobium azibense]